MSSETLPISNPRFAAALKDLSLASLHLKTLEIRNSLAHLAYSNAQLRPFAEGLQPTLDTAAAAAAAAAGRGGGDSSNRNYEPDPDCVEAIRENEAVMQRMRERIDLVRAEVECRGVSWREFEAPAEEVEDTEPELAAVPAATAAGEQAERGSLPLMNGVNGHVFDGQDAAAATAAAARGATGQEASSSSNINNTTSARASGNPWADGTFQTGVVRNGEVHMDAVPGNRRSGGAGSVAGTTTTSATATGGRLTDEDVRRLLEQRLAEDDDGDAAEEDSGLHL